MFAKSEELGDGVCKLTDTYAEPMSPVCPLE